MNKRAFTLIELLVVISIIAILMGIMMPALTKAREIARRTICANNLRNVWTAVNLYANDWNGKVSIRHWRNDSPPRTNNQLNRLWYARYHTYLPDINIYTCPAYTRQEADRVGTYINYKPSIGEFAGKQVTVTYTMNEYIVSSSDIVNPDSRERWYTIDEIGQFAARDHWMGILLSDGIYQVNGWGNWKSQQEFGGLDGRASYRHGGKAMFLVNDGRIGYFDEKDSLNLPNQGRKDLTPSMLK